MDITQSERVEQELDRLIDQRRVGQNEANLEAALWRESERRYRAKRWEANRVAWIRHHEAIAASLREDAERHAAAAERYRAMPASGGPGVESE